MNDLWRGRGRRRAADRIPVLTGERDLWMLLALLQASQLQDHDSVKARNVVLTAELQALQEQDKANVDAYDELAARYREIEADLRNRTAVSAPAIPIRDPDETAEIHVSPLWDAHGLPAVNAA